MNWQNTQNIVSSITSQKTIPLLNSFGLDGIRKLLKNSSYRVYINHAIKGNDKLSIAYVNTTKDVSPQETELTETLGYSSRDFENCFETDSAYYFLVNSQGNCFCLFCVYKENSILDDDLINTITMLMVIWSNQLSTLYFYQRDGLTGLLNRNILLDAISGNAFDSAVFDWLDSPSSNERRETLQLPEPNAVALIDIDNFKKVNDTWGHSIGDEVLIKMAEIMESTFRDCDVICRYGGEEFAVYLRYVSPSKALEVLERFRTAVESTEFPKVDKVTVSIGYTITFPGILASELIERADSALYYAKSHGKNKVVAAEDHQQLWGPADNVDVGDIELFD